jgi:hypothetical protein
MKDGSNSMSEKEFIVGAIEFLDNMLWPGIIPNYDAVDEYLDKWLEYHHNSYYEVEFIRKQKESEDEYGVSFERKNEASSTV